MKKILLTKLFLFIVLGLSAQVYNTAPGVYVGTTGFVDNFTGSVTSWNDSTYFWTTPSTSMYALSQTGNGVLTIAATNADPSYKSFAAYGINDNYDPINISGTGKRKVVIKMTNTSTTDDANIRIILLGVHNGDTVDINSGADANNEGYGTWLKGVLASSASPQVKTLTFDLSTPFMEHTPSDNPRFPHNQCNVGGTYYYSMHGTCVTPVQIDSIIGFRMWINAGGDANTSVWPFYAPFTGTVTIDKLTICGDPTTGILEANSNLSSSIIFPNPTAGKSNIDFTLKNSGLVKIDLKDSRGMLVKNISSGNLNAGDHNISVSTENIENGIYHITFQFEDGSVHTDRLVVIK